ncbi:amino acid adenylation domain-containing protein [Massilia sp. MB5]|uniref:non-ribosomal peptide synthetase n=1 Tax=Massilia sp. MB5 TaxID=2919578 RepID=UPI0035A2C3F0
MQAVDRIAILDTAERAQMLHGWNHTERDYRRDLCLHEIIEEQVRLRPQAVAVEEGERRLSYRELDEQANRLARQLRAMGVGPDQRVALCLERSAEMVIGLLAVLKAGGAYVPLDPGYPAERLALMLSDSAPRVLLTQGAVADSLALPAGLPVLRLDGAERPWLALPAQPLPVAELDLTPSNLAYVIYTSGSTGQPKGVMNEHVGIVNRLLWMQEAYRLQPEEAVLQKTPFSFDVSVWEFFWPLMRGARLVMARPDGHKDPAYLADAVARHGITTLHFVPSMLQAFLDSGEAARCTGLKRVMCSGEALPAALARRFLRELPGVQLHNLYGPTEAAVDVTAWHCAGPELPDNIPLGRPVANTRIYVLDRHGQPVPAGVAAEIHIGGVQVARGYLNRPELTRERFVPDPFTDEEGARLYRTGDLGRWLADGTLEYLGRNDHQVKLRGQRIELGEIEAQLLRQSGVREAVVLAREDSPGDQRLVAYLVAACALEVEMLRAQLACALPDHMIPAAFVQLDSLPLTPNGKLDRKALPAPDGAAYRQRGYEAPQGATETALAAIWADLLQLEQVGRHDHFFELGGHSLLALRMLARLRQACALEATLADLFAQPVLADLARHLDAAPANAAKLPPIEPAAAAERAALSFAQQRLWFLAQMDGAGAAYHLPLALQLQGRLDRLALQRALARIVARHEALRTSFVLENGEPVQRIGAADGFVLREDGLDKLDPAEAEAALRRLVQDEAEAPFDLAQGPLLRARLLRLGETRHVLLLTQHHIVSDGWSMGVFLNELEALYGAFAAGAADPLPPLALQYADYAAWQRRWLSGAVLQAQLDYWRQTLQGAPALLELPADRPRPARQDYAGAWLPCRLDAALTAQLRALSQRNGTSLFMTLLASWALLLGRLAGQEDVVVGAPSANRSQAESEQLIGFFVNTLALRIDLSGAPSVAQLLARVKAQALAAQQHQELPFEQVVEALRPERSLAYSPLFQTVFVWQNTPRRELALPGLSAGTLEAPHRTAKFDLSLILREDGGTIEGGIEYATALFDAATAERYLGYWRELLAGLVAGDAQPAAGLALLTAAQRAQLLEQGRGAALAYPAGQCIHELIEEQAAARPQALAVAGMGHQLSYADLNTQANRLAHHLRGLGVGPDVRVALCLERGPEMVVALLAVLKAGGAYVPLDPAYPAERLVYMLGDSAPAVLLTQAELGETLKAPLAALQARGQALPLLDVVRDARLWSGQPDSDPPRAALADSHLAYIIYTSGSTGQPKGVMVPHAAVRNLAQAQIALYGLCAESRVLQFVSFGFDVCVSEVMMALCSGASLHLAPAPALQPGAALLATLRSAGITHLNLPSAALALLPLPSQDEPLALEVLVVGGDILAPQLARQWSRQCRLFNAYGPTEATVCSLNHLCDPQDEGAVPLGRPLANTRSYILDAQGQPVPPGVTGELHIGGAGVARGYLGREDLTAQRFLTDPFSADADARMYRSGDMARWLPDGSIEFLGRDDFQVKLRGFRIELGEIEACLAAHPDVADAAVLARGDGEAKRLVAYYTPAAGRQPEAGQLRGYLAAQLPEYMVPAAYMALSEMPLTPNGKLDRKALPAPDGAAYRQRGYEAPLEGTETALAAIWAGLLQLEQVGRHDHFFELGGHSLLALRMLARLRQACGLEATLADLFAQPVLADLARHLDAAPAIAAKLPPIVPAAAAERAALSFAQQRLWFLAQMDGAGAAYHLPLALQLQGRLDRLALQRALARIVARHEALRTSFVLENGEPVQRIGAADGFVLREDGLDKLDPAEAEAVLRRLVQDEAEAPFDLAQGPLLRARLLRLGETRHVLLLTQHHIVSDGWSMGVFLNELEALYGAFAAGAADPLPPLALQYADYAAWQRRWLSGAVLQAQLDYWRQTLQGAPTLLELPADRPRPARQDYAGAWLPCRLDAALTAQLRALSQRNGTSLFMTLLASWALLLGRLAGQEDVVVGAPSANRSQAESEQLIGFFVNTLALRIDLSGAPSVAQLLARVKAQALAAQQHQELPFEQVVEALRPERSLAYSPLFQTVFVWQNTPRRELALPGLSADTLEAPHRTAKFDLSLILREDGGTIEGGIEYATALFDSATAERYLGYWRELLAGVVAGDAQPAAGLALLTAAQRAQLLEQGRGAALAYPAGQCIHELIEEQAAARPQALAVAGMGHQLSYAELNTQANRLAHHLRGLGVGPDVRVALCLERGPEMVVALLAVLKAGGAYVPLDPAYPAERLAYMLGDSAPAVLLTQAELGETLKAPLAALQARGQSLPLLDVVRDARLWSGQPDSDPPRAALADSHLAYIIYTSGSTGQPKGVMVRHRNLVHSTWARRQAYGEYGRFLLLSPISFDSSVAGIFGTLCWGGALFIAAADTVRDPHRLFGEIAAQRIESLLCVPSLLQQILEAPGAAPEALARVIVAGEACPRGLPARMAQRWPQARLYNEYGPTEATVWASVHACGAGAQEGAVPIGRPIANSRIYILDEARQPVPPGVRGEIHIGGAGVALGYQNRDDLSAQRFLADPFSGGIDARMYRSGDMARWLPDGCIEFLGRDDFQVKLRGFRIELGEIEACLAAHPEVAEAAVLADGSGNDMRLLAYYVDKGSDPGAAALRRHLQAHLPAHMVPAICTRMPRMPLTPNGKLDRKALPPPEGPSCAGQTYAEPEGALEQRLAAIWSTLLKIKRIGRHDNFFELGAHSLMLVGVLERMREQGLHADVQALFTAPTVAGLAATLVEADATPPVPPNLIPRWEAGQQARITPAMLPLVQLTQAEIDGICATVEGGAANVQDIYPLAPLQEGILYHHVTAQGRDPYVMAQLQSFDRRERLDTYLDAWQAVIARHDMLRTAVLWQGLSQPVQVVWRHAELPVREVRMAAGADLQQRMLLEYGPARLAIDIARAPLLQAVWTHDTLAGRWLLLSLSHHLGGDHTALDVMQAEIDTHLLQRQHLLAPALPFRDFIAHTRRAGRQQEDEAFFRAMLADVDETTLPAGLALEGSEPVTFAQARMKVDTGLSLRLRAAARRLSVSAASLHHLAWALVLARLSGREDVVFGTVLFGRMQGGSGADRALGLFMNTLPLRMQVDAAPLADAVRSAHAALAGLMRHEHASLALAQRCSAIAAPAPLFAALLNYRHSAAQQAEDAAQASEGIQRLAVDERNNYPLTLAVDDLGLDFGLTAQVQGTLEPERVCRFMHAALKALVTALGTDETMPLYAVDVLPPDEYREALAQWQSMPAAYPRERCVHQLFEEQAAATPQATALVYAGQQLSYAELNARANRLARHLRRLGAGPDQRVAVCLERGPQLLTALLAVLKSGAAYVPLDPAHPAERLAYTLDDCAPLALLTQGGAPSWAGQLRQPVLDLLLPIWEQESALDLAPDGLQPVHLAYVIYTSGSTGKPKGVMVEHRGVVNFLHAMQAMTGIAARDRVLSLTTCAFDISVLEMFLPLSCGAGAVLLRQEQASDAALLAQAIAATGVTLMQATPATWTMLLDAGWPGVPGLKALCGGEAMTAPLAQALLARCGALWNVYGPTETTVWSSALQVTRDTAPAGTNMPLGAPIANTSIYLLDGRGRPVPAGVAGEICIGGDGVARGYLNRPELTQERFIPDPFRAGDGARLYRTGDLGRRGADGMLEFLGRNDFQLKLRGYRIEPGEIEALLAAHPALRQAVVVARSDGAEAQLVAYCVAQDGHAPNAQELRRHLAAELPPYMVPAAYVLLEALPLTANGKLDRRALPAPDGDAYARRGFEAPQGPLEQALAEIWAAVLKQPRVGRHDNFFELGGHSLLVIALLEAMRQRGLHVEARSLFTATTLAGLAALTEEIEEIRI